MSIYFIQNTIDERGNKTINGYFSSLKRAKEELKNCCDWYRSKGTGKIYRVELNSKDYPELVYEN